MMRQAEKRSEEQTRRFQAPLDPAVIARLLMSAPKWVSQFNRYDKPPAARMPANWATLIAAASNARAADLSRALSGMSATDACEAASLVLPSRLSLVDYICFAPGGRDQVCWFVLSARSMCAASI